MRSLTGSRKRRGFLAILATLLLGLTATGPAVALSPPPADKAEIFFTNGGRIVSIKSDGTDRNVLTRRNAWVSSYSLFNQGADSAPLPSPDGQTVVFSRYRDMDGENAFSGVMSMNREGGEIRTVIANATEDPDRIDFFWPVEWTGEGSRLYLIRYEQTDLPQTGRLRLKTSLITILPDGSDRKVLFSTVGSTGKGGPRGDQWLLSDADFAADGKSVLLGSVQMRPAGATKLEVVDIGTGQRKLLARDASSASWSPDGESILFASEREHINKSCNDGYCDYDPQLYVMNADGTGIRRLVPGKPTGSSYPGDWSRDGSRIVFSSDMAGPKDGNNHEIWTVAPDGSCLTRITNGSPESHEPAWGAGNILGPGTCGEADLRPVSEVTYPKRAERLKPKPMWVGDQFGGLLLDDASIDRNTIGFLLNDCSLLVPEDCPPSLTVSSAPVCEKSIDGRLPDGGYRGMEFRKGGLVVSFGPRFRSRQTYVFTGRREIGLYTYDSQDRPIPRSWHLEAVDALRPLGSGEPPVKLAEPAFALDTLKTARTMLRAYRQTGSLKKAANRAEIFGGDGFFDVKFVYRRAGAASWLRFARDLNELGKVRSVRCKGSDNVPGSLAVRSGQGRIVR